MLPAEMGTEGAHAVRLGEDTVELRVRLSMMRGPMSFGSASLKIVMRTFSWSMWRRLLHRSRTPAAALLGD